MKDFNQTTDNESENYIVLHKNDLKVTRLLWFTIGILIALGVFFVSKL